MIMTTSKTDNMSALAFPGVLSPLVIALLCPAGTVLAADISGVDGVAPQDIARNVDFDPSLLQLGDTSAVDLSRYANGANITPGTYSVSVYVNDDSLGMMDVEFREAADKTVYPCLTDALLRQIPFRDENLPKGFYEKAKQCTDINTLLPGAVVRLDSNEQRLNFQLPQMFVSHTARGTVSPQLWDSGIPAAMLGYNLNGYQSTSHGQSYKSFYAGLNAGLNVGAWYLRHNGSYNWDENGRSKYESLNTYLQRDIPALRSRALIGESYTRGDVFDTIPFTGVKLSTDERMLPDSQRGYAPEVRGIARTNAKVTVRQNGQVIYQTTVAPGAFLIDDLYPTGYGGDLQVTVEEADGSRETFSLPYSSVVQQLRPGATRYEIVGGELRNDRYHDKPALYQATVQHGISNAVTGYGGLQVSQDYYAIKGGVALGTQVGAFSFDVTQARMHVLPGVARSGQSYGVNYSKSLNETQTSISVAGYRFSSSGYMDFLTAQDTRHAMEAGYSEDSVWRPRNRVTLTASQGLPESWGQFYISSSLQDYWNQGGTNKQYQIGYNNNYGTFTYGLSVGRSYSFDGAQDTWLFNMSFPLGKSTSEYRPQLSAQLTHDSSGRTGEQATLSGTGGKANQFSYSVSAMNANQGVGTSASVNTQYRTNYSGLSASWSGGKNYHSESLGATGTIVAHSGGITLSPYTSETFALVEAKGASGAGVSGYPGIHIDPFGYALVPYLDPYQMNDITLDPKGAAQDVELSSTEKKVAPYYGAVVKLKYNTRTGSPVLINATLAGEPVPFGAEVLDEDGRSVGTVGQAGQIYARVEQDRGSLTVKWGQGSQNRCQVSYHLIPVAKDQANAVQTFNQTCQQSNRPASGGQKLLAMSAQPDSVPGA
ncbi:fimbria/pilus outer membrane usher protein [Klebsiella aerogenes]|uniref:fimbria/pilus outer membrane usher protein n=1 Tax=Klebsiella aerogenes TaxID=548 RepID=UPI002D7E9A51|nr:fimbria/pilus outer membrane usher protein [Klebsiella aerogenes]